MNEKSSRQETTYAKLCDGVNPSKLKGLNRGQCGENSGTERAWGKAGVQRKGEARPCKPCRLCYGF